MRGLLAGKTRPIGLDLGHDSVKMIQLVAHEGRFRVLAAEKFDFDPSISWSGPERDMLAVTAIRRMLRKGNFRGRRVVSCLSNNDLRIKSLRVDVDPSQNVDDLVRKEAIQRLGLDGEKDHIQYLMAGSVQQGAETRNEVILFATEDESLRKHIALLEQATLEPVAIDTVPCAMFRSFQTALRRMDDRSIVNILVDVGSLFTTVVVGRYSEVSFVKQIPIAGSRFNHEIADKLGIGLDEAAMLRNKVRDNRNSQNVDSDSLRMVSEAMNGAIEELAREISLCFRYCAVTFRGKRPGRVIFTGGNAHEQALLDALKRHMTIEVEVAKPLGSFDTSDVNLADESGLHCEWAVAVGLSLKGLDGTVELGGDHERN
jgi:type IV pilus assembly protein PilM